MWIRVKELFRNPGTQITFLLFAVLTLWRLIILFLPPVDESESLGQLFYWAASYQVIALWGALWGFTISRQWGGLGSVMGKAMIAFSFGLLLQSFGQAVYTYLIYNGIEIPYPSLGDVGFFGSIPCYIIGIVMLARASGVAVSLRSFSHQALAIIIPLLMLLLSYFFFLQNYEFDWSAPLTIFLDFGYPLGQAVYVSLAILTYLLSRKVLGGMMRVPTFFFLAALIFQYISDYSFLYQSIHETYTGGGIVDYFYMTAYFLMAVSLIQLRIVLKQIRS